MSLGTRPPTGELTPSPEEAGRIPGEVGVWVLIFGDLVVFSVIFAVFIHARGTDTSLFNASQATLHRTFGGLNTLILLTSSLLVALAVNVFRSARRRRAARNLLCGAVLCAGAFLVNKGTEWTMLLMADHGPLANDYYMYFFVLTGLHAVHVVLGIILLSVMIAFTSQDVLSEHRYSFVESGACFWHLVDILWLIIFPLLYLMH